MHTFTITEPSGAQSTITAETVELLDGAMVFLTGGNLVAAFAAWNTVIEQGVATTTPAPPVGAEPPEVTALRESLRARGATI